MRDNSWEGLSTRESVVVLARSSKWAPIVQDSAAHCSNSNRTPRVDPVACPLNHGSLQPLDPFQTVGLRATRQYQWLRPVEFRLRETFADAREVQPNS